MLRQVFWIIIPLIVNQQQVEVTVIGLVKIIIGELEVVVVS